jgi:hypothetical protein
LGRIPNSVATLDIIADWEAATVANPRFSIGMLGKNWRANGPREDRVFP